MITLTPHAEQCLTVLHALDRGKLLVAEAAQLLGRSVRQVRRLRAGLCARGPVSLVHGNRGRPRLTLIATIDEATGEVPADTFRDEEDAHGYFLVLQALTQRKGIPVAVYSDRHGIFHRTATKRTLTLQEQLAGKPAPTQVARALQELSIRWIPASSPQAKGRIERLFGTFQDRLRAELRLAGVTDRER